MGEEHHREVSNAAQGTPAQPTTLEGITAAWQEASDALRDSERQYRELVEYSLGLICTHDLTGRILSINPAAAASLGYRPGDGIGHNLREFLSSDTRHLFDDYLRRMQEHGRDAGLMRVVARNGSNRVWMYRNVLSRNAGGSYVLGHAVDITDRVAAERTLRESEHALRLAHAELEARVKERTAALQEANARLLVEIAEREKAERLRERSLIDQRDVLAFLTQFSDRLSPVVTFEALIEVVRTLPVPFLADWTMVHVVNDDGTVRFVPDVSPNAALPAVAPDPRSAMGQVIATGHLAVVDVPAGDPAVALIGAAAASTIAEGLSARSAALLPLIVDTRVKAVLCLMANGARGFSSAEPLVLEEVTRRLALALERIQLYREAQEANRLKDEFLGTLSHELRTPLNAIFGWARILRSRPLDDRTAHAVEVIERNAESQIRLIEEVLDVSRIIRGKMTLSVEPVELAAILRATIDTVRPTIHAKRLRLEAHIDEVPPVLGDAHRLQQVFWNLLSNALKFTGSNGTITLALRSTTDSAEFEITDTGVGIRREVLPFVFDRFRQADSSTTRMYGGLGLGLAIVKHIVELHGGSVRAASSGEGHGATFTIRLPAERSLGPAEAVLGSGNLVFAESQLLRGRTILVVEDHDDARELIVGVLESAGARVLSASTTSEGVALAEQVRPDVLVADLGLPGEDGYALLARLRAMFRDIPALALTAYARTADRERVLAAGFQQHVVKPVDPLQLLQLIAEVLG
jgi:PAS domain S-box-containing protein